MSCSWCKERRVSCKWEFCSDKYFLVIVKYCAHQLGLMSGECFVSELSRHSACYAIGSLTGALW